MSDDTLPIKRKLWAILLPLSIGLLLACLPFYHNVNAAAQEGLQCDYAICVDWERTGSQDQKPSSIFPITVRIEPNQELKITVFGPGGQMIYEKSLNSDENGWVWAEYEIPSNATEGYYRVNLSTMAEEGKSYSSLLFTIGSQDSNQVDRPYHIAYADATQNGEYKRVFSVDEPIDVVFKFGNPIVNVAAGIPVNVALYDESNMLLDNATINTVSDIQGETTANYTFNPKEYGFYRIVASVTYGGFTSDYQMAIKVKPEPEYAFEVDGKRSIVTIDRDGEIGSIKSVSLDVAAKKLDIEIEREMEFNILEVRIPYELLGDPYTVLTDGELVNLGPTSLSGSIYKDKTFAIIRVPVDNSVSHIEIIGTSVIPEFGLTHIALVATALAMAGTIITSARLFRIG